MAERQRTGPMSERAWGVSRHPSNGVYPLKETALATVTMLVTALLATEHAVSVPHAEGLSPQWEGLAF